MPRNMWKIQFNSFIIDISRNMNELLKDFRIAKYN
jgi:hypothetical protein